MRALRVIRDCAEWDALGAGLADCEAQVGGSLVDLLRGFGNRFQGF